MCMYVCANLILKISFEIYFDTHLLTQIKIVVMKIIKKIKQIILKKVK